MLNHSSKQCTERRNYRRVFLDLNNVTCLQWMLAPLRGSCHENLLLLALLLRRRGLTQWKGTRSEPAEFVNLCRAEDVSGEGRDLGGVLEKDPIKGFSIGARPQADP